MILHPNAAIIGEDYHINLITLVTAQVASVSVNLTMSKCILCSTLKMQNVFIICEESRIVNCGCNSICINSMNWYSNSIFLHLRN